tara:strand:- start:832 stop:3333 length:2502 start_codon:yes stop_codon:yes gene_type:complete
MSVIKSNGAGSGASGGFYNGVVSTSARFSDSGNKYLQRTDSTTPTSTQKFTFSCWIKNWSINSGDTIFGSDKGTSGGPGDAAWIQFTTNRAINIYNITSASYNLQWTSTPVYRDVSAWYHFVIRIDTTQGSADDRVRFYVNGTQQAGSYSTTVGQNNNVAFNNAAGKFRIAGLGYANGYEGDFYLADVHHCDGQSYAPTEFAETKNGVWIPKNASVSYGNTGYRLQFKNSTVGGTSGSASTIGADTSGNTHHFDDYNISASDCAMPDSPENNFCTLNPLNTNDSRGEASFSEGNLRITSTSSNRGFSTGTFKLTGKHYFEVYYKADNSGFIGINDINNNAGGSTSGQSIHVLDGTVRIDGTAGSSVTSFSTGDVIGVEVDVDAKSIQFFKNGSSVSNNTYSTDAEYFPFIYDSSGGRAMDLIVNFGQDATFAGNKTSGSDDASDSAGQGIFYETPSSGFLALCTSNLPEPTIGPNSDTQADDHFKTVIYSGSNSSQTITTGLQPDWIWIKVRSLTGYHNITDTSRGITRELFTNTTDDEENTGRVASTSSTGFTLADSAYGYTNENGQTFVSWNWHANGGTTTTNDASSTSVGNIDSVYQANTTAGFSIVTYTGNGTNNTDLGIAHGLGVTPKMVWVKNRSSGTIGGYGTHWQVYNSNLSASATYGIKNILLNTDGAESEKSDYIKTTSSTTFTIRSDASDGVGRVNKNGDNYIAYVFAEVVGYSKLGSYLGNGNADGAFVFTGFRPAWIIVKRTDTADNWAIYDSVRDTFNVRDSYLYADSSAAEATYSTAIVDFLSNGFKWRGAVNFGNHSSGTYIYMAFAEAPFKYANAT